MKTIIRRVHSGFANVEDALLVYNGSSIPDCIEEFTSCNLPGEYEVIDCEIGASYIYTRDTGNLCWIYFAPHGCVGIGSFDKEDENLKHYVFRPKWGTLAEAEKEKENENEKV